MAKSNKAYLGYSIHKSQSGFFYAAFRGAVSRPFPSLISLKRFLRDRNARPLEDRASFTNLNTQQA